MALTSRGSSYVTREVVGGRQIVAMDRSRTATFMPETRNRVADQGEELSIYDETAV